MTPVSFKYHNVVFGKDQPEYVPLPAYVDQQDPTVPVLTCWEFTDEEIEQLVRTKQVWLRQLTFGGDIQPLAPQVENPFVQVVTLQQRPFIEVAERAYISLEDASKQSTEVLIISLSRVKEALTAWRRVNEADSIPPGHFAFNIGLISDLVSHREAAANAGLN